MHDKHWNFTGNGETAKLTVLKMCSNFGLIAKQNSILYALRLSILLNFANGRKQELYMTDESKLLWIV